MFEDARMRRRVRIEIVRWSADPREMFAGVSAQYGRFVGGLGLTPFPISGPALQERNGARDSFGPLRMPWCRIFDATWIVKNNHRNFARLQVRAVSVRRKRRRPGSGFAAKNGGFSAARKAFDTLRKISFRTQLTAANKPKKGN
jgi:hypothetical protein